MYISMKKNIMSKDLKNPTIFSNASKSEDSILSEIPQKMVKFSWQIFWESKNCNSKK